MPGPRPGVLKNPVTRDSAVAAGGFARIALMQSFREYPSSPALVLAPQPTPRELIDGWAA